MAQEKKVECKPEFDGKEKKSQNQTRSGRKSPRKGWREGRKGEKKADKEYAFKPKTNDASWYFKYPELAKAAARIAFNHRNGGQNDFSYYELTGYRNIDSFINVIYLPNPGISKDANSGVNVTSYAAWKMMNRRFRGVSKYQQADFGIIQFGILDFMSSLSEAERIYGLLNYYALNNIQVPRQLLIALGVDPDSFPDLADYRLKLNRLILSAKTLCLVKGYALLDHILLFSANVFKDKDNPRAQLFGFSKPGYWLYDPTHPNGSSLTFRRYGTNTRLMNVNPNGGTPGTVYQLRTQDTILIDLQTQLQALLTDDDVDNVCSDVLAFYGNKEDPAEIVSISLVPEDYIVKPIYSEMVNRQFHNMVIPCSAAILDTPATAGSASATLTHFGTYQPTLGTPSGDLLIYQEDNMIKFNIYHYHGGVHLISTSDGHTYPTSNVGSKLGVATNIIIDTDIMDPTPEDVMEMTRLCSVTTKQLSVNSGGNTYYYTEVESCSSVFPLTMVVTNFLNGAINRDLTAGTGYSTTLWQNAMICEHMGTIATSISDGTYCVMKFDWAPILIHVTHAGSTLDVLADIDNYVAVGYQFLRDLNDIAILSEFKNPISDYLITE